MYRRVAAGSSENEDESAPSALIGGHARINVGRNTVTSPDGYPGSSKRTEEGRLVSAARSRFRPFVRRNSTQVVAVSIVWAQRAQELEARSSSVPGGRFPQGRHGPRGVSEPSSATPPADGMYSQLRSFRQGLAREQLDVGRQAPASRSDLCDRRDHPGPTGFDGRRRRRRPSALCKFGSTLTSSALLVVAPGLPFRRMRPARSRSTYRSSRRGRSLCVSRYQFCVRESNRPNRSIGFAPTTGDAWVANTATSIAAVGWVLPRGDQHRGARPAADRQGRRGPRRTAGGNVADVVGCRGSEERSSLKTFSKSVVANCDYCRGAGAVNVVYRRPLKMASQTPWYWSSCFKRSPWYRFFLSYRNRKNLVKTGV